jgi:hypothetical protein
MRKHRNTTNRKHDSPQSGSTDLVWSNRFHWCAVAAGFIAHAESRLAESSYVKELAYEIYESGAFRDRVTSATQVIDATDPDMLLSSRSKMTESDL